MWREQNPEWAWRAAAGGQQKGAAQKQQQGAEQARGVFEKSFHLQVRFEYFQHATGEMIRLLTVNG